MTDKEKEIYIKNLAQKAADDIIKEFGDEWFLSLPKGYFERIEKMNSFNRNL